MEPVWHILSVTVPSLWAVVLLLWSLGHGKVSQPFFVPPSAGCDTFVSASDVIPETFLLPSLSEVT